MPIRAYCDMQARVELCTDIEEEHHGVTREPSMLKFTMTSIMHEDAETCDIWAVRENGTNIPIGRHDNGGHDIC